MAGEQAKAKIDEAGEQAKEAIENERENAQDVIEAAKAQTEEAARTATHITEAAIMGEHAHEVRRAHERLDQWRGEHDLLKSELKSAHERIGLLESQMKPAQAPLTAEIIATPPVGSIQATRTPGEPQMAAALDPKIPIARAEEGHPEGHPESPPAPRKPRTRWL